MRNLLIALAGWIVTSTSAHAVTYSYDVSQQGFLGTITCEDCGWLDAGGDYDFSTANESLPADLVYTGPDNLGTSAPDLALYILNPDNSGIQNELTHLELLAGLTPGSLDKDLWSQPSMSSLNNITFNQAGYLIMKFGDGQTQNHDHAFLYVAAGGSVSYDGKALSHITFGPDAEIPLPATAFLMVAGFGALSAVRRRKKA
ncbi:MAG: VPLPA-CTERM sorting domain-containing protein [Pseudooceanicola sp.]